MWWPIGTHESQVVVALTKKGGPGPRGHREFRTLGTYTSVLEVGKNKGFCVVGCVNG